MATFISFLDWTEKGMRDMADWPKRAEAARSQLRKLGGEIKDVYVTMGGHDLVVVAEAPDSDTMAKFAVAIGRQGNVRTETARAFTEAEWGEIIADLPK